MNKNSLNFRLPRNFLFFVAFFEGGAVMAIELSGAKMLDPYFGSSIYSWGAILAISLLGLTAGYYLGGLISGTPKFRNKLAPIILTASLLTALMPFSAAVVAEITMNLDFRIATFISALVFLFPPLLFFGMITLIIIQELTKKSLNESGKITGKVFAISTLGGIVSTYATGFYFIPEWGPRLSVVFIALFTGIFAILLFQKANKNVFAILSGLALFLIAYFNYYEQIKPLPKTGSLTELYSSHGLLGHISVVDNRKLNTRALFINNISQSYIHIPTMRSQWTYVHRLTTYASFKPSGSKVLLIGLGGGNIVNEFYSLGFKIDACDIDKRMGKVASQYFGMKNSPNINIITDDARHLINTAEENVYDIIVLDVSAGENQPNNLYTLEGFGRMKSLLKDNGVLFIHYPTILGTEAELAFQSICKTLSAVSFKVSLINTHAKKEQISEQIIFASPSGINLEKQDFSRRYQFAKLLDFPLKGKNVLVEKYNYSAGYILRDNYPIMDKLHFPLSRRNRNDGINVTLKMLLEEGFSMF